MIQKYVRILILFGCLPLAATDPTGKEAPQLPDDWFGLGQRSEASFSSPSIITAPIVLNLSRNLEFHQYPVPEVVQSTQGASGYHALKNALLTLGMRPETAGFIQDKLQDPAISSLLFGDNDAPWRAHVIEFRRNNLAVDYFRDKPLSAMKGSKKIGYRDITSFDFIRLYLEKAVVNFDTKDSIGEKEEYTAVASLLTPVAKKLAARPVKKSAEQYDYLVTRNEFLEALIEEAEKKSYENPFTQLPDKQKFEMYFPTLGDLEFSVVFGNNENTIRMKDEQGNPAEYKRSYMPTTLIEEDIAEAAMNGSHLTAEDMQELIDEEKRNPTGLFESMSAVQIQCLESAAKLTSFQDLELDIKGMWLKTELTKATGTFTAVMPIQRDGHWFSCVLIKNNDTMYLIITDTKNQDRRFDPAVAKLISILDEKSDISLPTPKEDSKAKTDELIKALLNAPSTENNTEDKTEKINYDAPLANRSLEKLPSLEQLFGGKVPNAIRLRIAQLKAAERMEEGTEIKNGLLLYGPPGTGKSTIAQVMLRQAGRKIFYRSGSDFRTAYQGSAAKLIYELFDEALKYGGPCAILVDEIDGATSKVQPQTSTMEDSRSIIAFIKRLDEIANNPNIFVIFTSNYPEKIDPAIIRRVTCIEIPNPHFTGRRQLIEYYIAKNGKAIEDNNPQAVTPKFVDCLTTASNGFSGDALRDAINEAVQYEKYGFEPEKKIGMGFRLNVINPWNKSVTENVTGLLELPYIPLLHALDGYSNTLLDKHIYAQFKLKEATKADLEKKEKANDPNNKAANQTWTQSGKAFFWDTAQKIWHGICVVIGNDLYKEFPAVKDDKGKIIAVQLLKKWWDNHHPEEPLNIT